jgi:hypothetical protein
MKFKKSVILSVALLALSSSLNAFADGLVSITFVNHITGESADLAVSKVGGSSGSTTVKDPSSLISPGGSDQLILKKTSNDFYGAESINLLADDFRAFTSSVPIGVQWSPVTGGYQFKGFENASSSPSHTASWSTECVPAFWDGKGDISVTCTTTGTLSKK